MSTNSSVTIKHSDGKYHNIYGHWDGHIDTVGKLLHEHFNSQKLAEELVSLGDFSSLHESIDNPPGHSYDTPVRNHSIFYHRDRGEDWKDTQPNIGDTYDEAVGVGVLLQSYNYLWDNEWLVHNEDNNAWMTIPEALKIR